MTARAAGRFIWVIDELIEMPHQCQDRVVALATMDNADAWPRFPPKALCVVACCLIRTLIIRTAVAILLDVSVAVR
jgi:hypothetical protein